MAKTRGNILYKCAAAVLLLLPCLSAHAQHEHRSDAQRLSYALPDSTCKDAQLPNYFTTIGFEYAQIDTIKIVTFKKGSDFHTRINSFYTYTPYKPIFEFRDSLNNLRTIYTKKAVYSSVDFEIIIDDTMVYKVTNMKIGRYNYRKWKACIVTNYDLDGITHPTDNLLIINRGFNTDDEKRDQLIHDYYFNLGKH